MKSSKSGKNKEHKVHPRDRAKFDKVNALRKKDEGEWITVNGQHMFVAKDKKRK